MVVVNKLKLEGTVCDYFICIYCNQFAVALYEHWSPIFKESYFWSTIVCVEMCFCENALNQ